MTTTLTTGDDQVAKRKEPPAVLYGEIPPKLKERFKKIAEAANRKLNAELVRALERYCAEEERRIAREQAEQEDQ